MHAQAMKNFNPDSAAKEKILQDVAEDGFHIALRPESEKEPRYAYTIGLYHTYHHPEIVCFDLNPNLLGWLLNYAEELVSAGEVLQTNQPYTGFLEGYTVQFVTVSKQYYPHYLGYAEYFYQDSDFPVLQLVWPDQQQRFPWESEFNTYRQFKQPLLDR